MGGNGLKVAYILGYPRSGSTVLGNILGQLGGSFHAGEVTYLWERHLIRGKRYCACGRKVRACQLWGEVLSDDLGTPVTAERAVRWRKESVRSRHVVGLLRNQAGGASHPALRAYADLLTQLYRRISQVANARIIVDSSKRPVDGAVAGLLGASGITSYFIHLIRDPRGVVFSRQRKMKERGDLRRRPTIAYDALGWSGCNLAAEAVAARLGAGRSLRVIYEDFARQPRDVVSEIARMIGEQAPGGMFLDDKTVWLTPNHGLGGNIRSRSERGAVEIRDVREWTYGMGRADQLLVSGLSLPVMLRYGYSPFPS